MTISIDFCKLWLELGVFFFWNKNNFTLLNFHISGMIGKYKSLDITLIDRNDGKFKFFNITTKG